MNHAGEIRALVKFVRPHVAIITTIAPAHLEYFGTRRSHRRRQRRRFSKASRRAAPPSCRPTIRNSSGFDGTRKRGRRREHPHLRQISRARMRVCCRRTPRSTVRRCSPTIGKMRLAFAVNAAGGHIAMNAIAALLAARELGADVARGADELANFTALKGRGARFAAGGVEVIDERYNANPASMAAAIELLAKAAAAARRAAHRRARRHAGARATTRRLCTRRSRAILRRRAPISCFCAART